MSTKRLLLLCAFVIILSWIVFAVLFLLISSNCGLQANTLLRAVYLAIETIETIGYGVPDSFFNDCHSGVFVLSAAVLWESIASAIFVSVAYTRISRGNSRAFSICFTETAIISEIAGVWYFMLQVCDFRKHQLCEAHIRLYSIQHAEVGGVHYLTSAMRLQLPDDELGAMLLPALPQLVVHRIDPWSPLWPFPTTAEDRQPGVHTAANTYLYPEPLQRKCDDENGNRDPCCGMAPGASHVQQEADQFSISRHLAESEHEIICILEGTDPSSSCIVQTRHSYTCDDIVFNASFGKCVRRAAGGFCEIDFEKFHEIIPPEETSEVLVQSMP
eukprot:NODE_3436_length_2035_cov_31.544549.p1 GENE.NODE_3436_length_2035_cov_31.544549~~NODE_3436_length_2035_cov_31.544549.p1  ORF type:complete len:330 (-),score=60.75 NODE_3436_length_2035_cov_31.544549:160-1149(-)